MAASPGKTYILALVSQAQGSGYSDPGTHRRQALDEEGQCAHEVQVQRDRRKHLGPLHLDGHLTAAQPCQPPAVHLPDARSRLFHCDRTLPRNVGAGWMST